MIRSQLSFIFGTLLFAGCGNNSSNSAKPSIELETGRITSEVGSADLEAETNPTANAEPKAATSETPAKESAIPERLPISAWKNWAPLCSGYPSKQNCDDGDATLFSGLLCIAGEDIGCKGVKNAQDPLGRFWRSPRRVSLDKSNSFSRDMALGVLAYLAASKDTEAAQKWLQWIDQHSLCQITVGNTCRLRTYHFCRDDTDGRCLITPGIWSLMRRVWEHMDLTLHKEMKTIGESTLLIEAEHTPIGYQLHLKGVMTLIYQKLGRNLSFEWDLIHMIAERQPDNLFFRYLHEGSSDPLIQALQTICPHEPPAEQRQWTWERDTNEKAQLQSMGWDCVFLGTLLLR